MGKNSSIILILIAIIIALVILIVTKSDFNSKENDLSPYSAVYLETGDIYFGKLKSFPRLQMTEVWLVQKTASGENNAGLNLVPLTSAFWGPADKINLNSDQVVFTTRLTKDSQVAKIIENPELLNQAPSPN